MPPSDNTETFMPAGHGEELEAQLREAEARKQAVRVSPYSKLLVFWGGALAQPCCHAGAEQTHGHSRHRRWRPFPQALRGCTLRRAGATRRHARPPASELL